MPSLGSRPFLHHCFQADKNFSRRQHRLHGGHIKAGLVLLKIKHTLRAYINNMLQWFFMSSSCSLISCTPKLGVLDFAASFIIDNWFNSLLSCSASFCSAFSQFEKPCSMNAQLPHSKKVPVLLLCNAAIDFVGCGAHTNPWLFCVPTGLN